MSSGKTVYEWILAYKEKHGHMPTKPIYLDYRCYPSMRKEFVMTFDEFERPWVNEYNKKEHGEVNNDNFHVFIPFIH